MGSHQFYIIISCLHLFLDSMINFTLGLEWWLCIWSDCEDFLSAYDQFHASFDRACHIIVAASSPRCKVGTILRADWLFSYTKHEPPWWCPFRYGIGMSWRPKTESSGRGLLQSFSHVCLSSATSHWFLRLNQRWFNRCLMTPLHTLFSGFGSQIQYCAEPHNIIYSRGKKLRGHVHKCFLNVWYWYFIDR